MTRYAAILALAGASKATKAAYDTLSALGNYEAARLVERAAGLLAEALGLVVVDKAQRMGASQSEAS